MKLRNKKTGEIKEVEPITIGGFRSLAELNEEWEDYEEPKKHYVINGNGFILSDTHLHAETIKEVKQIGNYFETREEAEKAVEKLKAWKRLKDKGFEIDYCTETDNKEIRIFGHYTGKEIKDDLDLLFGGEE